MEKHKHSKIYTAAEVAEMLGLSRECIYRKCKKKLIPHVRTGGKLLFSKKIIDTWLEGGFQNAK